MWRPCQSFVENDSKKFDGILDFDRASADGQLDVIRPEMLASGKDYRFLCREFESPSFKKRGQTIQVLLNVLVNAARFEPDFPCYQQTVTV